MTQDEKVMFFKALVDNDDELTGPAIATYLSLAAEKILRRAYPFDNSKTNVPNEYARTQCELAARMFFRRGAEGEISHSENGISRSFDSADDEDILSRITPYARLMI